MLRPLSACVFTFCTTNAKARRTWLADKEMMPLIPFPKQNNTTPTEAMEFVQGNLLPFCLSAGGEDKKTRRSLKNWIRITVQWLLSSDALGRTGNWVSTLPRITHSILLVYGGREMRRYQPRLSAPKQCTHKSFYDSLQKQVFIFLLFHLSFLKLFTYPVCLSVMGWTVPPPQMLMLTS